MSKEMREQIDRVKNWTQPLNEDITINFTKNQKRLREYIKILKENYDLGFVKDDGDYNKFDLYIKYFIIIHNFLFLENKYFDIIRRSGKEINKYLDLPKLESLEDIINKFGELYDANSKVRFSVETLDSIEEIRLLLPNLKNIMTKLYNNKSFNVHSLTEGKKIDLRKKYDNVLFSDDFYTQDENMIKYNRRDFLEKIDKFINFYKKYKPKGVRVIDGVDVYEVSKSIFDKIVDGEIYIDKVFKDPDNLLRNVVMLLHIDEPRLKRKMGD